MHNIKKVLALSTDKASSPINLYGSTKLVSDSYLLQLIPTKNQQNFQ